MIHMKTFADPTVTPHCTQTFNGFGLAQHAATQSMTSATMLQAEAEHLLPVPGSTHFIY
jgi:hypothetical protein